MNATFGPLWTLVSAREARRENFSRVFLDKLKKFWILAFIVVLGGGHFFPANYERPLKCTFIVFWAFIVVLGGGTFFSKL